MAENFWRRLKEAEKSLREVRQQWKEARNAAERIPLLLRGCAVAVDNTPDRESRVMGYALHFNESTRRSQAFLSGEIRFQIFPGERLDQRKSIQKLHDSGFRPKLILAIERDETDVAS